MLMIHRSGYSKVMTQFIIHWAVFPPRFPNGKVGPSLPPNNAPAGTKPTAKHRDTEAPGTIES